MKFIIILLIFASFTLAADPCTQMEYHKDDLFCKTQNVVDNLVYEQQCTVNISGKQFTFHQYVMITDHYMLIRQNEQFDIFYYKSGAFWVGQMGANTFVTDAEGNTYITWCDERPMEKMFLEKL